MTLNQKIVVSGTAYLAWISLWFALTMYVTKGDPGMWGRFVFCLFGPVCGIAVAFVAPTVVQEEIDKEKNSGK